jgi:hypothetical protein
MCRRLAITWPSDAAIKLTVQVLPVAAASINAWKKQAVARREATSRKGVARTARRTSSVAGRVLRTLPCGIFLPIGFKKQPQEGRGGPRQQGAQNQDGGYRSKPNALGQERGLPPAEARWLRNFINARTNRVRVDSKTSKWVHFHAGVAEGSQNNLLRRRPHHTSPCHNRGTNARTSPESTRRSLSIVQRIEHDGERHQNQGCNILARPTGRKRETARAAHRSTRWHKETIPHTQHCNIKPTNRKENHEWTVQRGPGPVVVKRKPPKRSATQRTPHTLHLRRSLSSSQNSSTTRGARETGATTAGAVRWNLPCPSLLAFIPLVFRFELREGACGMPTPVLKSPTTSARALALAHLDAADDGAATAGNDSDDV